LFETPGNVVTQFRCVHRMPSQFHGTIPDTIVKLQALDTLYLNQNFLTGPLPSGLVNRTLMPNLKNVFLHKNLFGAPAANACYDRYCSP
jgi:hypothetical protein